MEFGGINYATGSLRDYGVCNLVGSTMLLGF